MEPRHSDADTIAAIATAPGTGAVGIVRLSGPRAFAISSALTRRRPEARQATVATLSDPRGEMLDQGLVVHFPGPHSFTGEDVAELHCHGGPVLLQSILRECLHAGARIAQPGEFSQRAFLNDKIDLLQAEAIADLIGSASEAAARSAARSLSGVFSTAIEDLSAALLRLRVLVEAALDFPEEDIDHLMENDVIAQLEVLAAQVAQVLRKARRGHRLREGIKLAIAGPPNAGKSSLLNRLAQRSAAIVSAVPGTTRDALHEHIQIDGLALHLVDTAGLRDTSDALEREGIRRAHHEIHSADHVLLIIDAHNAQQSRADPKTYLANAALPDSVGLTVIHNKCDLTGAAPSLRAADDQTPARITLSARSGAGVDILCRHLLDCAGLGNPEGDSDFSARTRHIVALEACAEHLQRGTEQLKAHGAAELVAEDLRSAQDALGSVSGHLSSDDLLGEIFSSFCIGK